MPQRLTTRGYVFCHVFFKKLFLILLECICNLFKWYFSAEKNSSNNTSNKRPLENDDGENVSNKHQKSESILDDIK